MSYDLPAQLDHLAGHIDRFGFDATAQLALRQVRRPAIEAGARAALVELLLDDATPTPVRNRAFGHIATIIARAHRSDTRPAERQPGRAA
ncbi:MAG TPA: hypothetical protein DCR14_06605 [Acidimicrobiaceae bacterium]|nr:hypothetical protein [Acidimicrobiaceae bacterium]